MLSDNNSTQMDLEVSPSIITINSETNVLDPFQRFAALPKKIFSKLKTIQSINIFGIDTLTIGFNIPLSKHQLVGWVKTKKSVVLEFGNKPLSNVYIRRHEFENGIVIRFKYIPVDYPGEVVNLLLVEFKSIPKLLGICSHSQMQDWEKGWDAINKILNDIPFLVKLPDIRDGIIYRIDLCCKFPGWEKCAFLFEHYCSALFSSQGHLLIPRKPSYFPR